jgi:DNA polymerase kappa
VKEKVKKYLEKIEETKMDPKMWNKNQYLANHRIRKMEEEKAFDRTWIHVDMDAFYAAVEMRDDPSLREVPLAVEDKKMIMTTNYRAREFGVRSGIPAFIGKKLCPDLIFRPPDFP